MGLVETTLGDGDRAGVVTVTLADEELSLIHISEPTRPY